ncbi:nuclear transport factor 2 family protein [Mycobacteroides franklinii]|uniref:nuclear transport factor 2 family protein n=1 Tax=Mycobacteroides franklinii TaxID=948102 RepID=UPI0013E8AE71|nr:hypothetical protein [Mycobacteroides franklinii]
MSPVEDRLAIADLLTGWLHRDNGQWDELAALFHEDATISVTWFSGAARDFVAASRDHGAGSARNKHLIASPYVTFHDDRALAETNIMIVADSPEARLGCVSHARFFDRISRRDGVWRIEQRTAIYDIAAFTFPDGPVDVDPEALARHPREYVAFAYFLELTGSAVVGVQPTRGSDQEAAIKTAGHEWLRA